MADPLQWAVRGVKTRLGAPYYPSLHYTSTYDAELAVNVLQREEAGNHRIRGIDRPFPCAFPPVSDSTSSRREHLLMQPTPSIM